MPPRKRARCKDLSNLAASLPVPPIQGLPSGRVVQVRGDACERGRQLGEKLRGRIEAIMSAKRDSWTEGKLQRWRDAAPRYGEACRRHAPLAWAELQGAALAGVPEEDLLALLCEWEVFYEPIVTSTGGAESSQENGPQRCTSFCDLRGVSAISGQTVDEDPVTWLGGALSVIIKSVPVEGSKEPTCVYFTHPGVPAYMGVNECGVSVCCLAFDDGTKNPDGCPVNAICREVLSKRTLVEAVAYLESVPTALPEAYVLQDGSAGVVVETSSCSEYKEKCVVHRIPFATYVVEANEPNYHKGMLANPLCDPPDACPRYRKLNRILKQATGGLTLATGRQALHQLWQKRKDEDGCSTLCAMVFTGATMHVKFRQFDAMGPSKLWITVSASADDETARTESHTSNSKDD